MLPISGRLFATTSFPYASTPAMAALHCIALHSKDEFSDGDHGPVNYDCVMGDETATCNLYPKLLWRGDNIWAQLGNRNRELSFYNRKWLIKDIHNRNFKAELHQPKTSLVCVPHHSIARVKITYNNYSAAIKIIIQNIYTCTVQSTYKVIK